MIHAQLCLHVDNVSRQHPLQLWYLSVRYHVHCGHIYTCLCKVTEHRLFRHSELSFYRLLCLSLPVSDVVLLPLSLVSYTFILCKCSKTRSLQMFRWTLNMLKDKNDVTTEMLHETMLRFLFIKWFMITNYKMKENRSVSVRFDFVLMFVDFLLLFNSLWLSLFKRHKFAPNYQNKAQRSINMTIFKLCIEAIQSSDFNINIEYCCKCV